MQVSSWGHVRESSGGESQPSYPASRNPPRCLALDAVDNMRSRLPAHTFVISIYNEHAQTGTSVDRPQLDARGKIAPRFDVEVDVRREILTQARVPPSPNRVHAFWPPLRVFCGEPGQSVTFSSDCRVVVSYAVVSAMCLSLVYNPGTTSMMGFVGIGQRWTGPARSDSKWFEHGLKGALHRRRGMITVLAGTAPEMA